MGMSDLSEELWSVMNDVIFCHLPATGQVVSQIMVMETQSGVRRTVHISEQKKMSVGTTGHVMLPCDGSVKEEHATVV